MKLPTAFSSTSRIRVALLLCLAMAASGQENKPAPILPNSSPLPATVELPEDIPSDQMPDPAQGLVSVDVSVTDKAGKHVSGLSERDFALLDNDRQRKIVSFQAFDGAIAQPANSLEIVLMIDELNMGSDSESVETNLSNVHREIENFLRANGGVLAKPTMIYRLTQDGLFAIPHASMDGNELAQEIDQPASQRQIWSPSAIKNGIQINVKVNGASHDAVVKATRAAREADDSLIALGSISIEERRRPGRKLMFWLGNGWPIENGKAAGLADFSTELLTRMREAHINLWSALESYDMSGVATPATRADNELATDIRRALPKDANSELTTGVNIELVEGPKPDSTDLRYLSLPVIAIRSGGGILDPAHDLAARIGERVKEESNYYFLTFDPPRTDVVAEYHHLTIELDKPDLKARVFEDYYDEPVFYDQAPATQSISVRQLQALIASAQHISDAKLAHQLDNMRLTERLSSAKLATLEESVRGKKVRGALEILADKSAFFAPPDDEIIAAPPPEIVAQRQMISNVISYINSTIPHLPDFLATRTSVQYYEHPANGNQTWKTAPADQSLHEGEMTKASIRYRQGKELVNDESVKKARDSQVRSENEESLAATLSPLSRSGRSPSNQDRTPESQHLKTIGAFGPILSTVTIALTSAHSQVYWDHWERGDNGRLAVFRYHVTQGTPFFSAGFCCLPVDNKSIPFIQYVPFHGVLALDPTNGAIMRLTVQSDLGWRLPLERSDLMIEYGPLPESEGKKLRALLSFAELGVGDRSLRRARNCPEAYDQRRSRSALWRRT